MDKLILFLNAGLWAVALYYWKRRKNWSNVGIIVMILYFFMSLASCHLFVNPETKDFYEENIYVAPLLYLFVIIISLIYPLLKIDYDKIVELKLPSLKLINPICIFIIICAVYQLATGLQDVKQGLTLMLIDSSNALDAYIDTTEANMSRKALSGSVNIIGFLVTTGMSFSMLFFFLYILYPNKNKKIVVGLIIAVMANPIMSVASGSREKVITTLVLFCFMCFLLNPLMDSKIRKVISVLSLTSFGLFGLFFVIISFARARGNMENLFLGFESYFGMSYIVFDQRCFFAEGTREGNWVSPLLNVLLGGKTYSQEALRDKYASLGVDNGIFYTFVGDFVLDYGPILAFLFLICFSLYCKKIYKSSFWSGGHIVLCFILLKLLTGFYLHQFTGIGGNLLIIELIIFYKLFSTYKNRIVTFETIKIK